jgi:hypothetical protein
MHYYITAAAYDLETPVHLPPLAELMKSQQQQDTKKQDSGTGGGIGGFFGKVCVHVP